MASYYDYEELRAKAVAADATQDDINNLGEWFDQHGDSYWNGEYYDMDNGLRLFPVYEEISEDQWDIVGWEIR